MADDLTLIASRQDFQTLIDDIDASLSELNQISDEYNQLQQGVNRFLESDDNMQMMQNNVYENVKAVHEAIGMARISKQQVQKTLEDMNTLQSEMQGAIEDGIAAAKSGVSAAIHASELGLI